MIIWLASYPKSGNTWIRSLLTSYFFTSEGKFNFKTLDNIKQFSSKDYSFNNINNKNYQRVVSKNWIPAQKIINADNKIHLLKTHNALCSINNNNFTDANNTCAAIYIVRDPRNIISSISNHYDLDTEESFKFLTNKKKIIFPTNDINSTYDFNFLSDWSTHYNSWKKVNIFPVKIIKYEDLLKNTKKEFLSLLIFLSKFMNFDINDNKVENSILSTNFENLKKLEKKDGFSESIISKKNKKKIMFFNLGEGNNWKKMLDIKIAKNIETCFSKEMKELKYL